MHHYSNQFYAEYSDESRVAAEQVVPHVLQLFGPDSVIDVGCGIGTWLSVFRGLGVREITGVDGAYVDRQQSLIDPESFVAADLAKPLRLPASIRQHYALAVSLEVAEHLPESAASGFVQTLTGLAPVVLFSAAIPHQGGDNHINEQWPDYWVRLFDEHGYKALDCMRDKFWNNAEVAYYYAQNMLVFIAKEKLSQYPEYSKFLVTADDPRLMRVHPMKWMHANDPKNIPLKTVLKALPNAFYKAVTRRLSGR